MLCVSLNCSNGVNRITKNVDEGKLQVMSINAVLLLTKETWQYIDAVWKLYVKSMEVQVTLLMFITCFIFICTVLCIITNDVQNKSDVIQELIVSSVFFNNILSILHEHSQVSPDLNSESTLPSNNPASFDIVPVYEKSSQLSEQVSADIHPEVLNRKHFRSRYATE